MDWLQADIANQLQFYTFPLEVIGLTLATIEVRFAELTRKLNQRIVTVHDAVVESDQRWRRAHPLITRLVSNARFHWPLPYWLHWTAIVLLVTAILGTLGLTAVSKLPELATIQDAFDQFFDLFFWWAYLPIMAVVVVVMGGIRIIVTFAEDRAVGTLGILIACLGVAGEAYQFMASVAGIQ